MYGYGSVTSRVTYRVAPRDLVFPGRAAPGGLSPFSPALPSGSGRRAKG